MYSAAATPNFRSNFEPNADFKGKHFFDTYTQDIEHGRTKGAMPLSSQLSGLLNFSAHSERNFINLAVKCE